jgi:carbon-monoxide dehydrogenase medium subunit
MSVLWQTYHLPSTVEETVRLLTEFAGNARIIAGGTDLMIDLQFGGSHIPLDALVDVTHVSEMIQLVEQDGSCVLGAATTHTAIVKSRLLEHGATCLVESCGVVGGPQVRNVGTLGGNVAHALPAADGTTSLVALGAEAEVAWGDGRREWLPIAALFRGPGISALDSSRDVLVAFRFRLSGEREGSAFKRIMRPQGVALPVLGCAVWVKLNESRDHYKDVRVCISPVAPTPVRAESVEAALRGQPIGDASLDAAVQAAYETLHPRTSKYRATGEYREYMMETLLRRALPLATERARTGVVKAEGVGMG